MEVLYFSRTRKPALEKRLRLSYAPLDELLRRSDFVSLHTPLTDETRGLIGRRELALMKETALLVNTGRGPLVDQAVLSQALAYGEIAGAALDVTDPEPIAADDPLLSLDNVVITPHIASASVATRSRMADMAVDNLLTALAGRVPRHTANPEATAAWRRARRRRLGGLS
jgi:phosphoglycerate dehydrogenase-like enzyme